MTRPIALTIAMLLSGCATTQPLTPPTAQQQLETAQLAFTSAEGVVAVLEATDVIKPAAAVQINLLETAAASALAKAATDVAANDTQAQTSLDALNSAIAAYSNAIAQLKSN